MVEGLVQRLRSIVGAGGTASVGRSSSTNGAGSSPSAPRRAAARSPPAPGRRRWRRLISSSTTADATPSAPDLARVRPGARARGEGSRGLSASGGTGGQWDAEAELRAALRSARIRILTQFNAIPQGVKFLVDLRADLLRYQEEDAELAPLDRELESQLAAWSMSAFSSCSASAGIRRGAAGKTDPVRGGA